MAEFTSFGPTLAELGGAFAKPAFELRFNQLQNTITRRLNDEIQKVNDTLGDRATIESLRREGVKLAEGLPVIEQYVVHVKNSFSQLTDLYGDAQALFDSLGDDDTVTADEVAAFNAQRDVVVEKLNNLWLFAHPDIENGDVVINLKSQLEAIEGLTAVAGTKADNQATLDAVVAFRDDVGVGQDVTTTTLGTAFQLRETITADMSEVQAELLEITQVEQSRKIQELEELKERYATILSAISLSFEVNSEFAANVANSLKPVLPEPGSVLNLFT